MNNNIIDVLSLIDSKNRSSKNWVNHNFLYQKLSKDLPVKLFELKSSFKNILLLSSDGGEALNEITKINYEKIIFFSPYIELLKRSHKSLKNIQRISGNFENLPFNYEKFDLIISNLNLHCINKKKEHFKNIYNLLKKEGLLLCNFFGENSLIELKNSLFHSDEKIFKGVYARQLPTLKMVDITDLLSLEGFKELVSEKISYKVYYNHVMDLLKDLKGTGENCFISSRKKSLMTNKYVEILNDHYKKKFGNINGLTATCDVISVSCWKGS